MSTTRSGGQQRGFRSFLDGIWASVPTPFREDGALDLAGVEHNARRFHGDIGLDGIFCNGLIAEQWSLTTDERKRVLETTLASAGGMKVGVVVNAQSLAETIDLAQHAAGIDAHHIVLMRPAGLTQDDDVERYIRAVAAASGTPIVMFDGGAQTGGLSAAMLARLADDEQIRGVKCTRGGDAAEALRAACAADIAIVDPYESHWLGNLLRFDLRALYADPEPYLFQTPDRRMIADYFAAYDGGDLGEAARLFRALEPIRSLYFRWIMAPLQGGRPVNAVLKRWFRHMGYAAGPVRAPLAPLSDETARCFDAELRAAFRQVFGADSVLPAMDGMAWKS
jgi:4-hydroxy-tetrahydrodipicolinate synthase